MFTMYINFLFFLGSLIFLVLVSKTNRIEKTITAKDDSAKPRRSEHTTCVPAKRKGENEIKTFEQSQ